MRYVLWGAFFLLAVSPLLLLSFLKNPENVKRAEALRGIAAETPVYTDFEQTSVAEIAKSTGAVRSIGYRAPAYGTRYDDVKSFYVRELSARGWELAEEKRGKRLDDETRQLIFRRGDYSISVYWEDSEPSHYSISYTWERP